MAISARFDYQFRYTLTTTILCIFLASCGSTQRQICGSCPPPSLPLFMAVAQRGANEVAVYPLTSDSANPPSSLMSTAPAYTIPAPGADSLMAGLFVGESPNTIAIFSGTHNGSGLTFSPAGSITSGVNDPAAFAIWPFNGTEALFVVNRGANDIAIYKGLNNVPTGFNDTPEMTISGLSAPNGLAFDRSGNLWVSQAANVVELTPPFTTNSAAATTIANGLQSPSAIAFDGAEDMYVCDKGKNAIVVYPAGGSTPSLTFTNGINGPSSMIINGSYLYVANAAGDDVAEYRLPLSSSSEPIATNAVDMNHPTGIAVIQ